MAAAECRLLSSTCMAAGSRHSSPITMMDQFPELGSYVLAHSTILAVANISIHSCRIGWNRSFARGDMSQSAHSLGLTGSRHRMDRYGFPASTSSRSLRYFPAHTASNISARPREPSHFQQQGGTTGIGCMPLAVAMSVC